MLEATPNALVQQAQYNHCGLAEYSRWHPFGAEFCAVADNVTDAFYRIDVAADY